MIAQEISICSTYISSPNIALVKYWGKYDQQSILPWNDSIGLTLQQNDLNTITTITFAKLPENSLLLNNTKYLISKRIKSMLDIVKKIAKQRRYPELSQQQWNQYHFKIQSVNSFPTASGMASSASGLACLAAALNGLFKNCFKQKQVSQLARRGSGSASRSVFGGLVRWYGVPQLYTQIKKPSQQQLTQLNSICTSQTIFPTQKLANIRILLFLANWHQKDVSSTSGMETSMKTSELIWHRNKIARTRSDKILQLFTEMSQTQVKQQQYSIFSQLAELVIKDSNQFHAICLDTYPPIHYLNQFSKQIMYMVDHILNPKLPSKIAYTYDAGPHAFLFVHKDFQEVVLSYFTEVFNLKEEHFNGTAKNIKRINTQKYDFRKYKGQLIIPHAVWATSVGEGAHQYKM